MVKRQRNQRGEGSRLKGELIEAAMRILDKSPYTQISLRMVAKEAGVTAPSVYMQFADAQALMKEVVHECWRQMASKMRQLLETDAPRSVFDTLLASVRAYIQYAMERPSRYQLLFDMAGVSALDSVGPVQPVFRVIAEPVEEMARNNQTVPLDDPILAALLVLTIAHGRIALAHTAPIRTGNLLVNVQEYVERSIKLVFSGCETIPPA